MDGARSMRFSVWFVCALALHWSSWAKPSKAGEDLFEKQIRPVLISKCLRCHGEDKQSGGLRLDSSEAILKGGTTGPVILQGKPSASILIQALRHQNDTPQMPPDKPLPEMTIRAFEEWIAAGAIWPSTVQIIQGERHWAFQPVQPGSQTGGPGEATSIDQFIHEKLTEARMTPFPAADRRTLIRRAAFDLTGLPPSYDEIEEFVADNSPEAFSKVVDRLLASPLYGEKWGRHWLDLVRYADTAGETADFPVLNAWRYRNYVIESFNNDKPYDEFLREQLAGDLLAQALPSDASPQRYRELIVATGFLGIARRFGFDVLQDHFLTIEDTIDAVGKSMLGVTIACARCHDHKYDPFTVEDYYGLYGIFESTRYPFPGCEKTKSARDMVALMPTREVQQTLIGLDSQLQELQARQSEINKQIQVTLERPAEISVSGEIPNGGQQALSAGINGARLSTFSVQAGELLILSILPKNGHGADSTGVDLQIQETDGRQRVWNLANDYVLDPFEGGQGMSHSDSYGNPGVWNLLDLVPVPGFMTTFVKDAERVPGLAVWRGTGDTPSVFVNTNSQEIKFITITQPARSIGFHPGPQGGVALAWKSPITGTISVTGQVRDIDATGGDGIAWQLEARTGLEELISLSLKSSRQKEELIKRRNQLEASIELAYAVADGQPHDAQIHLRGDPMTRGVPTPRRLPKVLGGAIITETQSSGRLQLANWIASSENPLTARVLVNRIWQHHFGRGIVNTPNDFGTRGEVPSHPELLDYLAQQLIENGWSIKAMHRSLMLTEAYQRASDCQDEKLAALNLTTDPANVMLGKFSRRRLSAEEIRDTILAVSGELEFSPGAAHPFPEEKTWGFTQHAPFSAVYDHNRRSVYLMTQRIKRHPFLALFDGADTNTSTPQRFQTLVPTQALFFMNDVFIHDKTAKLGYLIVRDYPLANLDSGIVAIYRRVLGRSPNPSEIELARDFLSSVMTESRDPASAWAAWGRVMVSSNEFLFID